MKSTSLPSADSVDTFVTQIVVTVVAFVAVKIGIALLIRKFTHE